MPDALASHAASRDPVELLMDEWDQSRERALVSLPPLEQQCGDVRVVRSNPEILVVFSGELVHSGDHVAITGTFVADRSEGFRHRRPSVGSDWPEQNRPGTDADRSPESLVGKL
jgi:hypothetical protein